MIVGMLLWLTVIDMEIGNVAILPWLISSVTNMEIDGIPQSFDST